jgi:hypothetical protein
MACESDATGYRRDSSATNAADATRAGRFR